MVGLLSKWILFICPSRCADAGVKYLESKVEKIVEENERGSVVLCENGMLLSCRYAWFSIYFPICLFMFWKLPLIWICISSRLVTAASGAASGRFLNYEGGGPEICVQTAYGIEVNVSFCSSLWWKKGVYDHVSCTDKKYVSFFGGPNLHLVCFRLSAAHMIPDQWFLWIIEIMMTTLKRDPHHFCM